MGHKNEKPFRFEVGEIIKTKTGQIEILEQIRGKLRNWNQYNTKYLKYKCCVCNYEGIQREYCIKNGSGCLVCGKNRCISGVNDIATLYPEKVHWFYNVEEAKKLKINSNKKVDFKCENCHRKIPQKELFVVMKKDFLFCPLCLDKSISWGEKFMWSLLTLLNIDFIHDSSTTWSNKKRYDFIISDKKIIIEMDGMQHSRKGFNLNGSDTVEEVKKNDYLKIKLANENGYEVIHIDSSDNSVKKTLSETFEKLSIYFDLSTITENKINELLIKPTERIFAEYWNQGVHSVTEISRITKFNTGLVRKGLKKAKELGLCDYDSEKAQRLEYSSPESRKYSTTKSVICLNNLYIFERMIWASRWCGTKKVFDNCVGKRKHAGKDPVTNEKLQWQYLEDYLNEHVEIIDTEKFIKDHLHAPIKQENHRF